MSPPLKTPMLANRSIQVFVIALAGLAAISCLMAFASLSETVGVPILSGIILGFMGLQANPAGGSA